MGPKSFDTNAVNEKKSLSKRVRILAICGSCALLLLVVVAIMNSTDNFRSSESPLQFKPSSDLSDELSAKASRFGLGDDETPVEAQPVPEPEYETPPPDQPIVIYQPTPPPRIGSYRRNAYTVRMAAAGTGSAVNSMMIGNQGQGAGATRDPQAQVLDEMMAAMAMAGGAGGEGVASHDPNGWARKQEFMKRALPDDYSKYLPTAPVSAYELKAGSVIPCVLISGIISDLPGNIVAQVSENVYDTATGEILLIPRGSRVVGAYDNEVTHGQSRVLVVWQRLVYPNGISVKLDNMGATDQSGYTGFKGQVNRHWNTIITSALMVSLMGAGVELAAPQKNGRRDENDVRSKIMENAAASVADAASQIISREIDRQPTIKIRPGYRSMIFVKQDMVLLPAAGVMR